LILFCTFTRLVFQNVYNRGRNLSMFLVCIRKLYRNDKAKLWCMHEIYKTAGTFSAYIRWKRNACLPAVNKPQRLPPLLRRVLPGIIFCNKMLLRNGGSGWFRMSLSPRFYFAILPDLDIARRFEGTTVVNLNGSR